MPLKSLLEAERKEFEKKFRLRAIPDAVEGWWSEIPNPDEIKDFLSASHARILESVVEFCRRKYKGEPEKKEFLQYNIGWDNALEDIIRYLKGDE